MLVLLHSESASVHECLKTISELSKMKLPPQGKITTSKIKISTGAFLSISLALTIDLAHQYRPGIAAEYSVSGSKEKAIEELQEKLNSHITPDIEIVDFQLETYTTPVTRRTYAIGVIVFNKPRKVHSEDYMLQNRRKVLAKVLELLNYNPKALNISELARMFGVSRDTIYNDIQQIIKNVEV
ncbi:helix-turn-helix domain-containing protein [Pyrococcus furiosus DSM 3638]|uniref:Helix-turn-helix domain-containing protein n=3 Tax=Pyrococcus furiosus TaxID=2261 RepID=A0A5C0XPV2_PYRFU|nr:helix-turn-helix domain-containing protein [Pyrococcus furiosus]AAL80629.1 hypothetical protein PF0505 [Pyrococcus furiosus DSM 3638]AFN03300.1 hypothetical protein PFC_01645 [Pyrococcus furiosus COM1]QEK78218.1 helix-turn-helix domain-containing protein [Pyrococcus furiosus DSM 3638]